MRQTKEITLDTDKGEVAFTITELSGPALLQLSGPVARSVQKLKPAFKLAREGGSNIIDAMLSGLGVLDNSDFQLMQDTLFKGHLSAKLPDGTVDPRAGAKLDDYFPASKIGEYLKLLYEGFGLSYSQLFQMLPQNTLRELNNAMTSADAVRSALQ